MKKTEKELELGAEGGSISIFHCFDNDGNNYYYHNVNEMSYDEVEFSGIDKNSKYSKTFAKALNKMLSEYHLALQFYPVYVNPKNKNVIIKAIKKTIKIDDLFNYERWAELLEIEIEEIKM